MCHCVSANTFALTTGLLQGYSGEKEEREAHVCSLEDSKEALIIELEQTKHRVGELEAAHSELDARSKDLAKQRAEWEEGIGEHEQGKNPGQRDRGQSGKRV